ncbi:MAG: hypothetical protein J0H43_15965, partial [Actinobacteria bacterium]|nr:hypothetical protein [Actinomycetota bacterium]
AGPLGGGRTARPSANAPAPAKSSATSDDRAEARQRSKKRAGTSAESVRIGADLARSRAKASKSRRTDG